MNLKVFKYSILNNNVWLKLLKLYSLLLSSLKIIWKLSNLSKLVLNIILDVVNEQHVKIHKDATYVCIEWPRFSTKAESKFYKSTGADIIGMTLVPECQLAREAQICYASISTVTDYDVWAEKPVTAKEVMETLSKNVEITKKILTVLIDKIPETKSCSCEKALEEAEF